jgi:hypothetical protein
LDNDTKDYGPSRNLECIWQRNHIREREGGRDRYIDIYISWITALCLTLSDHPPMLRFNSVQVARARLPISPVNARRGFSHASAILIPSSSLSFIPTFSQTPNFVVDCTFNSLVAISVLPSSICSHYGQKERIVRKYPSSAFHIEETELERRIKEWIHPQLLLKSSRQCYSQLISCYLDG